MAKITVYDFTETRISELADALNATDAHVIDALLNLLEVESSSERKSCADILAEYM